MRWPGGLEGEYSVLEGPEAAIVVPLDGDLRTVLVRQWRHPWGTTSWEAPAGTIEPGEEPLIGAARELEEETGLEAGVWTALGTARASASATIRFHIYAAQELRQVGRSPETYEADMILRELPLADAARAALDGEIQHAASAVAILRAAARFGLLRV